MKPTKNKVFCTDSQRTKMLFETEKKADNFIKFNKEEIEAESGYSPKRSYYCLFCDGWHVTSIKEKIGPSRKEQSFEHYLEEKEKNKITSLFNLTEIKNAVGNTGEILEKREIKIRYLESLIKDMNQSEKEAFFKTCFTIVNTEIQLLLLANISSDRKTIKDLRQTVEIIHIVKNKYIFKYRIKK